MTTEITDKQFVEDPKRWVYWPMLPMKKRNKGKGFPWDVGLIIAQKGMFSTIHLEVTLWDKNLGEKLKTCEKKVYASVDEMLADGWMCD